MSQDNIRYNPRDRDATPKLFGQRDASLPLLDPAARPRLDHWALVQQSVFARTDQKQTLIGSPDGRPFQTGHNGKVTRGLPRLDEIALDLVSLADRSGYVTSAIAERYLAPFVGGQATRDRIRIMVKHGLLEHTTVRGSDHGRSGRPPRIYRLTAKGWNQVAKPQLRTRRTRYSPAATLTPGALAKLPHHLGALSYAVQALDVIPGVSPFWFTPFWPDGHLEPPRVPDRLKRETKPIPLRRDDVIRPDEFGIVEVDEPAEIRPDVTLHISVRASNGRVIDLPLYIEYDRKGEPAYLLLKGRRWDSFRTCWAREHPAHTHLGDSQGAWLHVATNERDLLRAMTVYDQGYTDQNGRRIAPLSGAVGILGFPERWYYPGRENLYFALESDLYHGSLRAFQIPAQPPTVRRLLGHPTTFHYHAVHLLHRIAPLQANNAGRNWSGLPWSTERENRAA